MAKVGTAEYDVEISRAKVRAEVDAAGKEIEQGLGAAAERASKEIEDKLTRFREASGLAFAAGTTAALGVSIKAASDLNEAQQANAATFRDSAKAVDEFANSASKIGLSKQDALDATATFGALFVQLGVGTEESAKLSTELTQLAADFGSFKNADVTEVILAQSAAFRGEYDALQRFVPTINAAAVEQQALAETGKTTTKELTLQEKAMATYTLMLEGAGPALGDFARNQDSAANSTKIAKAEMDNTSASLGQALLPVYTEVVQVVGKLAEAFGSLPGPLQTGIVGIGGLTLAAGLLAPKIREGVAVMQLAGSKAVEFGRNMVVPASAVEGLGSSATVSKGRLSSLVTTMGGAGVAAGGLAAAGIGVYLLFEGWAEEAENARKRTAALREEAEATGEGLDATFTKKIAEFYATGVSDLTSNEGATKKLSDAMKAAGVTATELEKALTGPQSELDALSERMLEYGIAQTQSSDVGVAYQRTLRDLRDSYDGAKSDAAELTAVEQELGVESKNAAGATEELTKETVDAAAGFEDAANAARELFDARRQAQSASEGVANAERAVTDAYKGVADAQDGYRSAVKGVNDARRSEADAMRGVADAAEAVREAQQGVVEAQKDAAEASADLVQAQLDVINGTKELEQANKGVEDAEKSLAQAQRESKDAQDALNDARKTAKERLDDLEEAVAEQALDEESARIALERARERQGKLGEDDKPVSSLDRREAALAVAQAEERLADVLEANAEREAKLEEERAKGVEGSEEVVGAKDAITEAAEREKEAEEGLSAARERVVEVQEDLAERVVEAQERVVEANDRVVEANARVVEAQQGVEEATLRVRDAHDGVVEAQGRVVEAREAIVEAQAGVEEAVRGVEEANLAAIEAWGAAIEKADGAQASTKFLIEEYGRLASTLEPGNPLRLYLGGLIADLREAAQDWNINLNFTSFWEDIGEAPPGFNRAEQFDRRASGGRVMPGVPYLVGDKYSLDRAEVMVPDEPGRLVSSIAEWQAQQPNAGGMPGGGPQITVNAEGIKDTNQLAGSISAVLAFAGSVESH